MDERSQDVELLQAFARRSDQPAFAMLVRRHVDLVYATALRKVGDPGAAEEITQDVFGVLARNAWRFAAEDSVAAWLHRTTLLKGKAWWRGQLRRREREQTAAERGTTMKTPDEQPALRALVPLLDEGLLSLSEKDRTALLLRFYENQSLRAVGVCLGTGEDAAQKRVASALAKLVRFFQRRGYRTTTVAAAAAALQHTAGSAPALVVSTITQAAMHMSPPIMIGLAPLLSRLVGLSKLQAASLCAVIVAAPAGYQWNRLQTARHDSIEARAQLTAKDRKLEGLQEEISHLRGQSEQFARNLPAELALQTRNTAALGKLAELKRRLQGVLAASDYRWPEDLPYVRVPSSAIDNVHPNSPAFSPSGKLASWAVEFLGLTPAETEFTESHLSQYLQQVYDLASSRAYETNSDALSQRDGWVAKTVAVPDLGMERERLWGGLIEPIRTMLSEDRRHHFEGFWGESLWGGVTYPWIYEDEKQTKRSSHQYIFAVKPDGTETPQYSFLWVGSKAQQGRLPLRTTLPPFLAEHFDPWLQSLGISNIYGDQP